MCSYRTVADRLECCMDDLVDCFEDYVTKSLIAIFVALGIVVASVVYLLRVISERTLGPSVSSTSFSRIRRNENRLRSRSSRHDKQGRKRELLSQPRRDTQKENYLMLRKEQKPAVNRVRSVPSFDESLLREDGLSCCPKPCCLSKRNSQSESFTKRKDVNQSHYTKSPIKPDDVQEPTSRISIPAVRSINSPKGSLQSFPICPSSTKGSCCSMCVKQEP